MRALEVLYVGAGGGTSRQRAEALRSLGHRVTHVPTEPPRALLDRVRARLGRPPDRHGLNAAVRAAIARGGLDLLWVDKGLTLLPETLADLERVSPRTARVHYSPDDQMYPTNQSRYWLRGIPLYHLHVTTKTYNVPELRALGAPDVLFVDNAYDPAMHRPLLLDPADAARYAADVGFVGGYEGDRMDQMLHLARNGVRVTVWGYAWERAREGGHPNLVIRNTYLDDLEFTKCINATRINLGFLRKHNRDLQTTRSVEIPACRAFMLAERTDEHLRLFREGAEAEFFADRDELLRKCRHYLEHEEERQRIAEAGYRRCLDGGYSNQARLAAVLAHLEGTGRLSA
ncbi:MAG TPA: glycosyltransferase [Candidatus Polarisedimenticolaceae bacterium]|nr:glycosyltransferase [Candidatus Polarisedimenticolaceae bacterium]